MDIVISISDLAEYVPNNIDVVDGERSLLDRIAPWISEAKAWLSANVLPISAWSVDDPLIKAIVINRALSLALPSLDLTFTPSGLGVVSTETIAPASKDRVRSLADAYMSAADCSTENLIIAIQCSSDEQRQSYRSVAPELFDSFIHLPSMASMYLRAGERPVEAWHRIHGLALSVEKFISSEFIGARMMQRLRDAFVTKSFDTDTIRQLSSMMFDVVSRCMSTAMEKGIHVLYGALPLLHEWLVPVIETICSDSVLKAEWEAESSDFWSDHQDIDMKGAFYFG